MSTVTDVGPLDWRVSIVDKSGRPSPEFQRRWNTNRNNSALIGTINFGSGAPPTTPIPADGAEYVDTSVTPAVLYIGENKAWIKVGPTEFLELEDTPDSYATHGGQIVRVKSTADQLEFVAKSALTASPTATASDTVVNGVLDTFMRSDAAPAVQLATTSQFGLVKPDGSTVTITGGVISAVGGGGGGGGGLFKPPKAADFPTLLGTVPPVLTDDTDVGLIADAGTPVGGDTQRYAVKSCPTGADWTVVAGLNVTLTQANYNCGGLVNYESSSNKSTIWGPEWGNQMNYRVGHLTVPTGFGGNEFDAPSTGLAYRFFRMRRRSNVLYYDYSADGKFWINVYFESVGAYYNSQPDSVGIGFTYNSGSSQNTGLSAFYWYQDF